MILGQSTIVRSTRKPPQVGARATAVVTTTGASWDQVVDTGLTALGETRASLFGYGLLERRHDGQAHLSGTFTVYADRD